MMRKLYNPAKQQSISQAAKNMSVEHNVTFNVIDTQTGKVVQSHEGHNAATNSLLTGIAHYLIGDGITNQAYDMLSMYLPKYVSLGTMGLFTQDEDDEGLPVGLGSDSDTLDEYNAEGVKNYYGDPQTERLCHYISECPGFGADGYDANENGGRPYLGLGPAFDDRDFNETVSCELINTSFPRTVIALRDIVPENEAEIPKTIDIVYSGMISTGALAQFRGLNDDLSERTYLFITEAGLWSKKNWQSGGENGLLAGYRIVPPNQANWDFGTYVEGYYEDPEDESTYIPSHYEFDPDDEEHAATQKENQEILRRNILKVGRNQVVQVIWKIQIGALEQLGGRSELYPSTDSALIWHLWDDNTLLEYNSKSSFPKKGVSGYTYIDKSTNTSYIWKDNSYVQTSK